MADKVVFLQYRKDTVQDEDAKWLLSCKTCGNRTYVMRCNKLEGYPWLICAACGAEIGEIGWVHENYTKDAT